jgi:hypothetical protein
MIQSYKTLWEFLTIVVFIVHIPLGISLAEMQNVAFFD